MGATPQVRFPLPKLTAEANDYSGNEAKTAKQTRQNTKAKLVAFKLRESSRTERMGSPCLVPMMISKLSHQKPWDSQLRALRSSVMADSSGYHKLSQFWTPIPLTALESQASPHFPAQVFLGYLPWPQRILTQPEVEFCVVQPQGQQTDSRLHLWYSSLTMPTGVPTPHRPLLLMIL